MSDEAILSSRGSYTIFEFNGNTIRFKTSARLKRYTRIVQWEHGYLVVMAEYQGLEEIEEYIDLVPVLENLYYDTEEFLAPIKKVRIAYAA